MPNSTGAQMTKHTPGPWLVDRWPTKHHGCYGWSIRPVRQDTGAITGHQICCQYEAPHAVNFNLPADGSTDEANLRLIAAAPELLAALETALLCIDDEVNIYAPEMCNKKRVKEARARHGEGGTLHYYATAISKARAAIKKATS